MTKAILEAASRAGCDKLGKKGAMQTEIPIPAQRIDDFCRRWNIAELGIVGRKVDLVSERAIERSSNWIRRKAILESAEPFWGTEPCR